MTTTPASQDPTRRPARMALYVGVLLLVLGAIVLYLGYDGAAKQALVQAQFPFLISGGLAGLALVVLGGISIALHLLLQIQADFRLELSALRDAIDGLGEGARGTTATITSAAPSSNGMVMVAKGASSYHRADCRLVSRAENAHAVARAEAEGSGLIPCRICKP